MTMIDSSQKLKIGRLFYNKNLRNHRRKKLFKSFSLFNYCNCIQALVLFMSSTMFLATQYIINIIPSSIIEEQVNYHLYIQVYYTDSKRKQCHLGEDTRVQFIIDSICKRRSTFFFLLLIK